MQKHSMELLNILNDYTKIQLAPHFLMHSNCSTVILPKLINSTEVVVKLALFFSCNQMMAELERDFISETTKEGLRARKEQGIILGKPKETIQKSMYDPDRKQIEELYHFGVSMNTIIKTHLKYGSYLSLKYYMDKRIPKTNG